MTSPQRRLTPISYAVLIRVFEQDGFRVVRQRGDHVIMNKPGIRRPLVIKRSPGLVPVVHIMTNMRTAEMTRERYLELLERVS